jgi:hypothetical protein
MHLQFFFIQLSEVAVRFSPDLDSALASSTPMTLASTSANQGVVRLKNVPMMFGVDVRHQSKRSQEHASRKHAIPYIGPSASEDGKIVENRRSISESSSGGIMRQFFKLLEFELYLAHLSSEHMLQYRRYLRKRPLLWSSFLREDLSIIA